MNARKLAAIDIYFLGSKLIVFEYALGVVGLTFFGAWSILYAIAHGRSPWMLAFGAYLIAIGLNYVPLFVFAVGIAREHNACDILGTELADRSHAMRKYRRQSLLLLVPFAVLIASL